MTMESAVRLAALTTIVSGSPARSVARETAMVKARSDGAGFVARSIRQPTTPRSKLGHETFLCMVPPCALPNGSRLSCGRNVCRRKVAERHTSSVWQGNTILPYLRAPVSFKRLLGRALPPRPFLGLGLRTE